jgi:septum formation protein
MPPSNQTPVRVILASQSPRRRELLAQIGIVHEVRPADIDETVWPDEAPVPHSERLAREKAHALALLHPDAVVIGSDTIVVIDGAILGKPANAADAVDMLLRLSGREHMVYTSVAVAHEGQTLSGVEAVQVTFRPLDRALAEAYVATGEPMDKAGGYGIQGFGATLVEKISGDYFAVMGLPLGRLVGLIRELGYDYAFGPVRVTR